MAPSEHKTRNDFIVIEPTGKSKIYNVASRRVGSKERFAVVATTTSDTMAQRIVDGLASLQGEVLNLEVPAQRTLAEVREALTKERALTAQLRVDVRARDIDIRDQKLELEKRQRLLDSLQRANLEKA